MEAASVRPTPVPHEVQISVNNKPVIVPQNTTGAEILRLAKAPADFELFQVKGDEEIQVKDDETIKVHHEERFIACSTLDPS